jgi:DNA-binding response OmpR family regulator
MKPSRGGKAVLCIGNDLVNLNLRCSLLQRQGWRVLSSGRAHEGVIRFSKELVDAVVIDLDGDGSEPALIVAELKRQRRDIPVILLITDEKTLVPGATAQADAVLLKSEETQLLHMALKNLLKAA